MNNRYQPDTRLDGTALLGPWLLGQLEFPQLRKGLSASSRTHCN